MDDTKSRLPSSKKHYLNTIVLHPFQPSKSYCFYKMNCLTSAHLIIYLIGVAKKTTRFSIYIERSREQGQVNLIAIELIRIDQLESTILLFELSLQPEQATPLFYLIQLLLMYIFHPKKKCCIWNNDHWKSLQAFVHCAYLTEEILERINVLELQNHFKIWYNKRFKHHKNCYVSRWYEEDSSFCTCPYRPYKHVNEKWTIYTAMIYIFNESIDEFHDTHIDTQQDIKNSIVNCLAITKLSMIIELNWTLKQLQQHKNFHHGIIIG
ncbi:unnamed protein product [Rotaria magnacalcarata]|uniref:Uncharacterized protein n=2 Tax=Rotaria magnacalcarata TaxID=392030 RepID=A0A814J6Y2_9BILA|nr:unnamed protein product [Rotaria magnacalcarata]CAF4545217.1 unnamed protein product [Rotaria magnacalcarata]